MEILVSPDRHGRYATNMQFWGTFPWQPLFHHFALGLLKEPSFMFDF